VTDAGPQRTQTDDTAEIIELVIDAAERCYASVGFGVTTMDDVAVAAGIPRADLDRVVASRDELLVHVLLRVWDRESTELAALLEVQANIRARLIEGITFFVDRIAAQPYLLELVRTEGSKGGESDPGAKLLVSTLGAFLRPYFIGHGPELRADIDDTIEWLLRQLLLLLTVTPHRGLTAAEIRYQVRTFIVPSVLREIPEI
jgi:AcrR family transcriptional regulator